MKKTELFCGIAALVLVAAGIVMAVRVYLGYQKGRDQYDDMESAFTSTIDEENDTPDELSGTSSETATADSDTSDDWSDESADGLPDDAPERLTVDWDSLTASYKDCIAWLQIPAVEISYPVMQSDDNDYYLHRAPDGSYLYAGSIFMDYQNSADLKDYNTVIYGHNMRDGSMFAKLKQFRDSNTLVLSPYFWILTPDGDYLYRIFSVHTVDAIGSAYTIQFENYGSFAEWYYEMEDDSEIETGVTAMPGEKTVTLSTCNGNSATRLTVQGILVWQDAEINL